MPLPPSHCIQKTTERGLLPDGIPVSVELKESSTPSKENACPTLPTVYVAPLFNVPVFGPIRSLVFPSPFHHETGFDGRDAQAVSVLKLKIKSAVNGLPVNDFNPEAPDLMVTAYVVPFASTAVGVKTAVFVGTS